MKDPASGPPRLFLRFFRWFCDPGLVTCIEGDLLELYAEQVQRYGKRRADARFVIDVLLLFRPGITRRFGNGLLNTNFMFRNHFKIALRNLLKQKAYNALNVLGLAVGMASGIIIAMHIGDELSFDKAYPDYENIYRVHREGWATSSPPLAREFAHFFPGIEAIGRFSPYGTRVINTDGNNPGEATGFYADSSVLKVFGIDLVDGGPHPLTAAHTAVITRKMATRFFNGETAVGKILKLDDRRELTVTGVIEDLPDNSHLKFDFLVSMPTFYKEQNEVADANRGWMIMYTYVRMKPGALGQVTARMPAFIAKYYAGERDIEQKIASKAWRLMPLEDIHLHSNLEKEMGPNSSILYIYVFFAVGLLILFVASANFMSLFTTQALRRIKEVGMRKVMGAGTGHVISQFLTEVCLQALLSALLALVLCQLAMPLYNDVAGKSVSIWHFLDLQWAGVIGVVLLAVIAVSGLYPAIFIAGFRPGSFLKERKLPSSMPAIVRSGLVVFQFVVSVSLIAAAVIVRQQMGLMKEKDLGFDKEQVVSVKLYGQLWYKAFTGAEEFKNEFLANPHILAVGRVDRLIGERLSIETIIPEGKDPEKDGLPDVRVLRADEGYLDAMGIELISGRNFSSSFNDSSSYIINETAAKALELRDPLSTTLYSHSRERKGRIVGVIRDYHFATLHAKIEPLVIEFEPAWTDNVVFKLEAGKTREALEAIRLAAGKLAPNSLFVYQFLDDRIDQLYRREDALGKVFEFFSALAIIIAALGLFGLSAHTIETRTKEIGIRKVLGATVSGIMAMLSLQVFRLVAAGVAIAVPLTWYAATKWLENFAYRIEPQWWVFAFAAAMVMLIAGVAVGARTIRAATSNPVNSLRAE